MRRTPNYGYQGPPPPKQMRVSEEPACVQDLMRAIRLSTDADEVELRVGQRQASGEFRASVTHEQFVLVRRRFLDSAAHARGVQHEQHHELVRIYDGAGDRRREIYDGDAPTRLLRVNTKETRERINCDRNPHWPFDVRVALSRDVDLPAPSQPTSSADDAGSASAPAATSGGAGYTERWRRRDSFVTATVRLDLTEATTAGRTSYEIEVELQPDFVRHMRGGAPHRELIGVIQLLNEVALAVRCADDPHCFGDLVAPGGGLDDAQVGALQRLVQSTSGTGGPRSFPGAMPSNFHRSDFATVQAHDYFVSEKTDGVRKMCIVPAERALPVCLFDRSMCFDALDARASDLLRAMLATAGPTLLDAEIVRNLRTMRPVLMIFDALCINGQSVANRPFRERLFAVRQYVVTPYQRLERDRQRLLPFDIVNKEYYPKHNLPDLFLRIHPWYPDFVEHPNDPRAEERAAASHTDRFVFRDDADTRVHFTDGIIFARADLPYILYTNEQMMKWKYPASWTVDLAVVRDSSTASAFNNRGIPACGGSLGALGVNSNSGNNGGGNDPLFALYAGPLQRPRDLRSGVRVKQDVLFRRDEVLQMFQGPREADNGTIAELAFSTREGRWLLHGLRPDKDRPNSINFVVDTLTVLAENVSRFELVYRTVALFVSPSPSSSSLVGPFFVVDDVLFVCVRFQTWTRRMGRKDGEDDETIRCASCGPSLQQDKADVLSRVWFPSPATKEGTTNTITVQSWSVPRCRCRRRCRCHRPARCCCGAQTRPSRGRPTRRTRTGARPGGDTWWWRRRCPRRWPRRRRARARRGRRRRRRGSCSCQRRARRTSTSRGTCGGARARCS